MSHKSLSAFISESIKHEITRFESVHPSIYAIYDILEQLSPCNESLVNQMKEHIVSIEDSFVNSLEWTLSRAIPDIRLGILGSPKSGKSALVHRYLTGAYLQEESPEGGRFKKDVSFEGQSYLLMIRDEAGAPDTQFSHWVDAVILVFSLEDEQSFQCVLDHYRILKQERLAFTSAQMDGSTSVDSAFDIPVMLVGTQDAISEYRPRVVDEARARRAALQMNRSNFYETCAMYGLNVDRIFFEACKQVSSRLYSATAISANPVMPDPSYPSNLQHHVPPYLRAGMPSAAITGAVNPSPQPIPANSNSRPTTPRQGPQPSTVSSSANTHSQVPALSTRRSLSSTNPPPSTDTSNSKSQRNMSSIQSAKPQQQNAMKSSTKVTNNRQRRTNSVLTSPNLLPVNSSMTALSPNDNTISSQKKTESDLNESLNSDPIGSGRTIPLKMGYLEKRTSKSRRKKKFVIVTDEGVLTYYNNIKDFQENSPGKSIDLTPTTVKIPGVGYSAGVRNVPVTSTPDSATTQPQTMVSGSVDKSQMQMTPRTTANGSSTPAAGGSGTHKRSRSHAKSGLLAFTSSGGGVFSSSAASSSQNDDVDNCEFYIVSLSNRHWRFWAESTTERDSWVAVIKEAIGIGLQSKSAKQTSGNMVPSGDVGISGAGNRNGQGNRSSLSYHVSNLESSNSGIRFSTNLLTGQSDHGNDMNCGNIYANSSVIHTTVGNPDTPSMLRPVSYSSGDLCQMLREVAGNGFCADCGAENPLWASVNLGVLLCIHCAGIHRELGTHLSRVRSVTLDAWPNLHVKVMLAIGNTMANSVYEAVATCNKPSPDAPQEARSRFIREKYLEKIYLAPPPYSNAEGQQQLIDAIARGDTRQVILMLAINQRQEFVNKFYSPQDQRLAIHIAATLGHLVDLQLLAWAFANMSAQDGEGRNAYFYAVASGATECAEFLLHCGCSQQHVQSSGPTNSQKPSNFGNQQQHVSAKQSSKQNPAVSTASSSSNKLNSARHLISSGATLPRPRPNGVNAPTSSANSSCQPAIQEMGI